MKTLVSKYIKELKCILRFIAEWFNLKDWLFFFNKLLTVNYFVNVSVVRHWNKFSSRKATLFRIIYMKTKRCYPIGVTWTHLKYLLSSSLSPALHLIQHDNHWGALSEIFTQSNISESYIPWYTYTISFHYIRDQAINYCHSHIYDMTS